MERAGSQTVPGEDDRNEAAEIRMEEIRRLQQQSSGQSSDPDSQEQQHGSAGQLAFHKAPQDRLKNLYQPANGNDWMGQPARIAKEPVENDSGGDDEDKIVEQGGALFNK
jgi:hypothetical protein